jgi:hypothetical protein
VRQAFQRDLGELSIGAVPDRCLRELLDLCVRRRIPVLLYLMPEGPVFAGWYSAAARTRIDAFVGELSRTYGLAVVDARDWLGEDLFADSHHLLTDGATAFTRRFAREALLPFLEGRLLARVARQAASGSLGAPIPLLTRKPLLRIVPPLES